MGTIIRPDGVTFTDDRTIAIIHATDGRPIEFRWVYKNAERDEAIVLIDGERVLDFSAPFEEENPFPEEEPLREVTLYLEQIIRLVRLAATGVKAWP